MSRIRKKRNPPPPHPSAARSATAAARASARCLFFRMQGSGLPGFRVQGSGFQGPGCGVQGAKESRIGGPISKFNQKGHRYLHERNTKGRKRLAVGKSFKGFKHFGLKAEAIIRPGLSYACHIRHQIPRKRESERESERKRKRRRERAREREREQNKERERGREREGGKRREREQE